jgi:hypothetical protein
MPKSTLHYGLDRTVSLSARQPSEILGHPRAVAVMVSWHTTRLSAGAQDLSDAR